MLAVTAAEQSVVSFSSACPCFLDIMVDLKTLLSYLIAKFPVDDIPVRLTPGPVLCVLKGDFEDGLQDTGHVVAAGNMRRDHQIFLVPERAVGGKRFRLRSVPR